MLMMARHLPDLSERQAVNMLLAGRHHHHHRDSHFCLLTHFQIIATLFLTPSRPPLPLPTVAVVFAAAGVSDDVLAHLGI